MHRGLRDEENLRPDRGEMGLLTRVFGARLLPDGGVLFPLRPIWRPFAAYEFVPLPALSAIGLSLDETPELRLFTVWEIVAPILAVYVVLLVTLIVRRSVVIRPGTREGELRQGNAAFRSRVSRAAFYEQDSARQPFFDIDEGQFWMRCRWLTSDEERRAAMLGLNRLLTAGRPPEDGAEESLPRPVPRFPNGGKGAFLDALDVTTLSADTVTFRSAGFLGPLLYVYLVATMLPVLLFMLYAWFVPATSSRAILRLQGVEAATTWLIIAVLAIVCRVWRPQFKVTAGKGIIMTELGRRIERPYTEWEFQANAPEEGSESRLPAYPYLTLRLRGRKPRIIRVSLRYTAGALGDLAETMNRFLWGNAAETNNLEADVTGAWRQPPPTPR